MKTSLSALLVAAVTLASAPALAQERGLALLDGKPPPTGTGMIVTGSILSGIGAVNLITSPLCKTDLIPDSDTQDVCFATSLVIGGAFVAVGIPVLIVGLNRRSTYREWKRKHGHLASLTNLGIAPTRGGAALTWHTSF
jgi:hypothetical protein